MYTQIQIPEKINRNFTLCVNLLDKPQPVYVDTFLFGSKTSCFAYLTKHGTIYGKKNAGEFRKPLLTYKSFWEHLKKDQLVYVASTGVFYGKFLIATKKKI